MNRKCLGTITLALAFAFPIVTSAASTSVPVKKHHQKAINNGRPGSPGYTNSSPLGSAEKADKKAKKHAAKAARKPTPT